MIESINLENYRGFKNYHLHSLKRINLVVGKNNSGKTSLLEAINLLTAQGNPNVLARIARQRGELAYESVEREYKGRSNSVSYISYLFYCHKFFPSLYFTIDSNSEYGRILATITRTQEQSPEGQRYLFEVFGIRTVLTLSVSGHGGLSSKRFPPVPVREDGALFIERTGEYLRYSTLTAAEPDALYITQDSLSRAAMSEMWDKAVIDGREQDVVKAMQILEPKLTSVVFLSGEGTYRYGTRGGILLGFKDAKRRVPLGTYGEGMRSWTVTV